MKTQPKLSADFLEKWLWKHFRIEILRVQFMPRGECSWGFVLTDKNQERYFLKLWQSGICEHTVSDSAVSTMMALYYDFGIQQITPPPLRSNATGLHINRMSQYNALLLRWVHGYPATDQPLDEFQQRHLGALLATIHQSKLTARERPATETYAPQFLPKMARIFKEIDYPDGYYTPLQSHLLAMLRSQRRSLRELFREFRLARKQLMQCGTENFVVCHGDPNPANIVITPDDRVVLIDWDAPVYAMPERDLVYIHRWPAAMAGYESVRGGYSINALALRYYHLHWDLEEIIEFGGRALYADQSERQNEYDIGQLTAHLKGIGIL